MDASTNDLLNDLYTHFHIGTPQQSSSNSSSSKRPPIKRTKKMEQEDELLSKEIIDELLKLRDKKSAGK